jgi:hypothetical protein
MESVLGCGQRSVWQMSGEKAKSWLFLPQQFLKLPAGGAIDAAMLRDQLGLSTLVMWKRPSLVGYDTL